MSQLVLNRSSSSRCHDACASGRLHEQLPQKQPTISKLPVGIQSFDCSSSTVGVALRGAHYTTPTSRRAKRANRCVVISTQCSVEGRFGRLVRRRHARANTCWKRSARQEACMDGPVFVERRRIPDGLWFDHSLVGDFPGRTAHGC